MKLARLIVLVFSFTGTAANALSTAESSPDQPIPRAFVDPAMVESATAIEKKINEQAGKDAPVGTSPVVVLNGSGNLIVTAPHATEPFRNGQYRFADGGGTAALAYMLNKQACATVLYTQYRTPSDPNFYDDGEFKQKLAELVKDKKPTLVLDLHGSHDFRPFDVDLGTMNGRSLLGDQAVVPALVASLRREGISNFSNNFFAAEKNQTIIKFVSAKGVPAVQLEISSTWLRPSESGLMAHRFSQLLQGLTRFARDHDAKAMAACQSGA